jgi:hypothetical protein
LQSGKGDISELCGLTVKDVFQDGARIELFLFVEGRG